MVQITHSNIDIPSILDSVSSPESGAIDIFVGTTRNESQGRTVLSLTYEAYEPMAIKIMNLFEQEALTRWPLQKVVIVHRLGKVDLMEASVVIAVAAPHRTEAFEACRYLIDRLKKEVPIWKKEHFADGKTEWSGISPSIREREEIGR